MRRESRQQFLKPTSGSLRGQGSAVGGSNRFIGPLLHSVDASVGASGGCDGVLTRDVGPMIGGNDRLVGPVLRG